MNVNLARLRKDVSKKSYSVLGEQEGIKWHGVRECSLLQSVSVNQQKTEDAMN